MATRRDCVLSALAFSPQAGYVLLLIPDLRTIRRRATTASRDRTKDAIRGQDSATLRFSSKRSQIPDTTLKHAAQALHRELVQSSQH